MMGTELPPVENISSIRESGVLIRTRDEGNRRQLTKWVGDQETYDVVEADIQTGEFDCCILDWMTLLDNQDAIRSRKQAEQIPLSFTLLALEQRADEITKPLQDNGRELYSLVDELLRMPVSGLELEHRLELVLRARHQAVVLDKEHERIHGIRDGDGRV